MVTKEDIEGWLNRLAADGASFSEVEPGLWVVRPSGELDFSVVVHLLAAGGVASRQSDDAANQRRAAGDAEPPLARAQRE